MKKTQAPALGTKSLVGVLEVETCVSVKNRTRGGFDELVDTVNVSFQLTNFGVDDAFVMTVSFYRERVVVLRFMRKKTDNRNLQT